MTVASIMHVRRRLRDAGGGAQPVVATVSVNSDGWSANVTVPSAAGLSVDLGSHASPKLAIALASRSWTAAGAETTTARSLHATRRLRRPYPNQNAVQETDNGDGTITFPVALSDFVYAGDSISGIAVGAGFYTDTTGTGLANAAGTASHVQASAMAYPLPIATWLHHDREWVESASFTAKLCVAHRHFRQGQMVRAVKFIASDQHGHAASAIATAMSREDFAVSGLSASIFAAPLDFSGLDQGDEVTIDAVIYPWVGDAYQVSVNGAAYPSPNLTTFKVLNDRAGTYGKAYAYVDAAGGSNATGVASSSAATAAASPFQTVAGAASAIQTFNNANHGRNDVSGGIVRLVEGTHVHSSFAARAHGFLGLIVEAADPAKKVTTIYQNAASSVTNGCCDRLKFRNITLRKSGGSIIFLDMNATRAGDFGLVLDNVTFDLGGTAAYNAWIYRPGHMWMFGCDGDDAGQGNVFSTASKQVVAAIGCGNGSMGQAVYNAVGCRDIAGSWNGGVTGNAGFQEAAGSGLFFSHVGSGSTSASVVSVNRAIDATGLALVGNVIEKYASNTPPALSLNADSNTSATDNVVLVANTVIGGRSNLLYNDTGAAAKSGIDALGVHDEWNGKSDVFGTDGAFIGNWSWIHRIGHRYRATLRGDSRNDNTGIGEWLGELDAPGDANGSNGAPLAADWLDDRSFTVSGAGGGDYTPGTANALPQVPAAETAFPVDQRGRSVPVDGTALVGAIQRV